MSANAFICARDRNPHHCYGVGKLESAIHSAFYPGSHPFAAGGLAHVAGALCFYLVKNHAFMDGNKRTAALSAIVFLNENGWDLNYPINESTNDNALANVIEAVAISALSKHDLMEWFDRHKITVEQIS